MQLSGVRLCRLFALLLTFGIAILGASAASAQETTMHGVSVYSPEYAAVSSTGVASYDIDRTRVIPTEIPSGFPTDVRGARWADKAQKTGSPLRGLWIFPKMTGKMWRGFNNVLFGWVEVPKHMIIGIIKTDPFTGTVVGFVKGVGYGVVRTGVGVFEIVTFWSVWPRDFSPIVMPEYVVDDLVR